MLAAMGAAIILVCLPIAGPAVATSDLMPFWRTFFARPDAPPPAPPDNPPSEAKVALGRDLFGDPRLSGSPQRSCAACHRPEQTFSDGRRRAAAADGRDLLRNTPALLNLAWGKSFYWDGRAASIEAQAAFPILHPDEMGGRWPDIIARLKADAALDVRFHQAFADRPAIQPATILKALAAYERTLVSPQTRFDRFIGGDAAALTSVERDGFRLFVGPAGCVGCHAGWRFSDERFHDIGLPSDDPGRGGVEGGIPGLKAFKTPSLREVRWTAPYMHDGSKPTLDAVLDHYAGGFVDRPGLSTNMVRKLALGPGDRTALLAFLNVLSSDTPPVFP